jgi:hypothetical protein
MTMKRLILLALTIFLVSGCDILEFDDDINNNPNSPSEASAPQLLAGTMRYLPNLSSNTTGQFMAQYLAETQYLTGSVYPDGGTSFYGLYQSPLISLETVINNSTVENQLAVAKILKAYIFWHTTDRWGDIPYSNALQGSDNFTPAYDTQESIYNNLLSLLEEGVNQINHSLSLENDIMYGGDMERWEKFGNTLQMLISLRLSEVNPQLAESEFVDAYNSGIFTSNDDSFVYQHLEDQNNENYWHSQIERSGREWWALSETLVDVMEPTNDPRLPVYGDPARTDGEYRGLPMGSEIDSDNTENFSLLGEQVRQQAAPVYLVTYPQALFAIAEAAERGWITDSTEDVYYDAIENSIFQWTGSTDDVPAFITEPDIVFDPVNALEQIATQRYVHLFLNGYEAWAEWRRTGYPVFVQSDGKDVPTRQGYPADEAFNNTDNYNEAIQRQFGGDNTIYGVLWWDAN